MHLYLFLLVVISLSCGSLPATEVPMFRALVATIGMLFGWGLLCQVGARLCAKQVRQTAINPITGAEILERQLSAFRWLGLGVVVLCLGGFGLARGLDAIPYVGGSIFLQAMVLLFPGLAITALTWSAEHQYGVLLGYTPSGTLHHAQSIWQSFRANVLWLVVPVLLLLGWSDLIALLPIDRDTAGWITAASVLVLVPVALPWLVRHLFKTKRLDESTESWIGELMREVGLGRTRMARWDTGGQAFNAMVVGFVPPLRTLIVSDRLLDHLPRTQVAMVVLHEAAHLKRKHVPIRMLAILPAWGVGALLSHLLADNDWAMVIGSAIGIVLTMLILRLVAYRTEHDADAEACRMAERIAGRVEHVPTDYQAACETLSSALLRVTFDHPACRKATWLHPGVDDRIEFMRRQCSRPISSNSNPGTIANPA
jgi:Zn-dependent protease with chaperone function